jgi:hypothetical protein
MEEHTRVKFTRNPYYVEEKQEKKTNGKLIIAVLCLILSWTAIILMTNRQRATEEEPDSPMDPSKVSINMTYLDLSKPPDFSVYGKMGAKFKAEMYDDPVFGGPIIPFTKTRRNINTIREIQNNLLNDM